MKHKLKRLIYTIDDHIKDSKEDYRDAWLEKEEKDSGMATFYIQSAKQRLEMANKALDKFTDIIRELESRERQEGVNKELIEEKNMAWRCLYEILSEKVKYISSELSEFKI